MHFVAAEIFSITPSIDSVDAGVTKDKSDDAISSSCCAISSP